MNDKWTLVFTTAIGDVVVDSFECRIGSITKYIGKPGALRASIDVPSIVHEDSLTAALRGTYGASQIIDPLSMYTNPYTRSDFSKSISMSQRLNQIAYGPGRLGVYAYYGTELWWGGFLTEAKTSGDRTGTTIDISAVSWEGFFDGVEPHLDLALTNMEQFDLANQIVYFSQVGESNYDVGIDYATALPSGVKRDLSWKQSQGRSWASILNEMANRDNGFEWLINVYDNGTRRVREFTVGYPSFTRGSAGHRYKFFYPGNVLSYEISVDSLSGATSFMARGDAPESVSGTAQDPLLSDRVTPQWPIDQGLIARDMMIERTGVSIKSTLDMWANKYASTYTGPLIMPSIKCMIDQLDNGAIIGQSIDIAIIDAVFGVDSNGNATMNQTARVIGYEITPGGRGSADIVTLTLENPRSN